MKKGRLKKSIFSLALTVAMVIGLMPMSAFAAEDQTSTLGQVHVIVENTTFSTDDGAPWDGVLVDDWVSLTDESSIMSCVAEVLERHEFSQTGAESGYISEVYGLSEMDGGFMSGWMGTLNDWFTNYGFDAFTVKAGTLAAGDEIRVMYTCAYGSDLGSDWGSNDKRIKAMTFSAGELDKEFDMDEHNYVLNVGKDVEAVKVTPTASNKNYLTKLFVGDTEYKRTAYIPVSNGTIISVKCGMSDYPTMNDTSGEGEIYDITIAKEGEEINPQEPTTKPEDKPLSPETEAVKKSVEQAMADSKLVDAPQVGSIGGEWAVIGNARSGAKVDDDYYKNYIREVVDYVKANADKNGKLHSRKLTENSRVIIALAAAGYDPSDVAGIDLVKPLLNVEDTIWQGNNGASWGIIALNAAKYDAPDTINALIESLLDNQQESGGWAINGKTMTPDTDMTAMILQSLAPYYLKATSKDRMVRALALGEDSLEDRIVASVDKGLEYLMTKQNDDASFGNSSETISQVIVALTTLGIDPVNDQRFVKDGKNMMDALLTFATDNGFKHLKSGNLDGMATEQAYYAMTAYKRFLAGQTSLYDMSDVTLKKITEADLVEKEPENKEPESEVLGEQYENTDDSHISTNTGSNVLGAEYAQAPKTGDASNYGSLCVLMLIAIATFAVAYRKKQMN